MSRHLPAKHVLLTTSMSDYIMTHCCVLSYMVMRRRPPYQGFMDPLAGQPSKPKHCQAQLSTRPKDIAQPNRAGLGLVLSHMDAKALAVTKLYFASRRTAIEERAGASLVSVDPSTTVRAQPYHPQRVIYLCIDEVSTSEVKLESIMYLTKFQRSLYSIPVLR